MAGERKKPHFSRRDVLRGALAGAVSSLHYRSVSAQTEPWRIPGHVAQSYGSRSKFESAVRYVVGARYPVPWASYSPIETFCGAITPSSLHFERHHNGVPDIAPDSYRLLVGGLVDRPRIFTLDDLKRFPSVSRMHFIECAGNSTECIGDLKPDATAGQLHGLSCSSEWTGVLLSTLMREVGVRTTATWMIAEGADAALLDRSIPIEKCWDDILVAYGQNGEAVRPEQGYPIRLVVSGWEGNINIKWLRRLEFLDRPAMTREETVKYVDPMPDGTVRQFSFVMEAKSLITFPSGMQRLPDRGFYEIQGIAWSGRGRISRVEVSTDAGRTWQLAELQGPVLPKTHTRFRSPWVWNGQETVIQSRATDETGYRQPPRAVLLKVRRQEVTGMSQHFNGIQSWHIGADGQVRNTYA
ncbi:sulfite dehydrogenase [Paraburkholderia aspalathi]|uniref:sulfite dehydrogenase n=1 Tax=Paraburkholderia aspalathi TaxID=1324617 RepID=UPI001B1F833E|nr:sulfite dehydrogenase [Paraburkholderia aspalathi]CAE6841186.1 hypothetical protein R20943_07115 [Paraburkholderia aspalathi]